MSNTDAPNLLQMVAQYAQLEEALQPLLPQISQKLIADLLASGTKAENLAKVIGRPPSFVRALAAGGKGLSAKQIVKVLRHVALSQKGDNDASQS